MPAISRSFSGNVKVQTALAGSDRRISFDGFDGVRSRLDGPTGRYINLSHMQTRSFVMGASLPAFAHHSFAAEFDWNKTVALKGTVTKLECANPHMEGLQRQGRIKVLKF
jgi:hypothetical protein